MTSVVEKVIEDKNKGDESNTGIQDDELLEELTLEKFTFDGKVIRIIRRKCHDQEDGVDVYFKTLKRFKT